MLHQCTSEDKKRWVVLNKEFIYYEYQEENVWNHPLKSGNLEEDFDNIMNSIDDYKREVGKMVDLIISHSNYTRQEVEEHISKDWYVRMDEAQQKGLVDQIINNINMLL